MARCWRGGGPEDGRGLELRKAQKTRKEKVVHAMSLDTYNVIMAGLLAGVLIPLAVALFSLVFVILRWRTPQRRKHVIRLLLSIVAVPCLIGAQQAILWLLFLPALAREHMAVANVQRAERLAATSLIHVGGLTPDFEVTDSDGATFSMANAKGKVVVINFFATWCGPCMMELPHIEELWTDYRDQDKFALLVIGREETMETVREFRSKKGFSFPIAPDPDRDVYSLFAKESIPRTIVVSADGVVVYSQLGFVEEDMDELRAVLTRQLAGLD